MDEKQRDRIRQLPNKKVMEKKILDTQLNHYGFSINSTSPTIPINGEEMRKRYNILLQGKVQDKELREQIIKHSEEVLKNRTSMHVIISGTNKDNTKSEGAFQIIGISPTYEQQVSDYFLGRVIPSNEFNKILQDFKNSMSQSLQPILQVVPILAPQGTITITQVDGTVELQ